MSVVAMGVHVLDVLARPVEEIPEGQGGALVEQIRAAPAGAAGGTAVTLAKLGASVQSAGAIGADPLGDLLLTLLEGYGVGTSMLLRRKDLQTSASVLPIRANGDRPALHVIGANASYGPDDCPAEVIADATNLHLGGPEFMGGEAAAEVLAPAREAGTVTSADILADGNPGLLEWIEPALPHLDYLCPNEDQILGFTGLDDLEAGAHAFLEKGVGCVAVTRGAEGAMVVDARGTVSVPTYEVDVVDTSGCGDAFTAGFLRGLALGLDNEGAARVGCASAAMVATGLGSDAGEFNLETVEEMVRSGGR